MHSAEWIEKMNRAIELRKEGKSYPEIAREMGCTYNQARRFLRKMETPRPSFNKERALGLREKGLNNRQIAEEMGCSRGKIQWHIGSRKKKILSDEGVLEIRKKSDKVSISRLCDEYGISTFCYYSRIKKLGVVLKKRERKEIPVEKIKEYQKEGMPYSEIGKVFNVTSPTIIAALKRNGEYQKRKTLNKEEIISLWVSGLSQVEVAKKMGCTRQYVSLVIKKEEKR